LVWQEHISLMHTIFLVHTGPHSRSFQKGLCRGSTRPSVRQWNRCCKPVFHNLKPPCHSQLAADAGCCSLLQCVASSEKQCEGVNPETLRGGYIQKMKRFIRYLYISSRKIPTHYLPNKRLLQTGWPLHGTAASRLGLFHRRARWTQFRQGLDDKIGKYQLQSISIP
jgi:hypothetical protein